MRRSQWKCSQRRRLEAVRSVRGFREDRSESLRTLRRRRLVVRPLRSTLPGENQLIPLLSSPAISLSPTAFSPPSQSSLFRRQTAHASSYALVRGPLNHPKLLLPLVLRPTDAVSCVTAFRVFSLRV